MQPTWSLRTYKHTTWLSRTIHCLKLLTAIDSYFKPCCTDREVKCRGETSCSASLLRSFSAVVLQIVPNLDDVSQCVLLCPQAIVILTNCLSFQIYLLFLCYSSNVLLFNNNVTYLISSQSFIPCIALNILSVLMCH